MNFVRCEKGHFYDQNVSKMCPYCIEITNNAEITTDLRSKSVDKETSSLKRAVEQAKSGLSNNPLLNKSEVLIERPVTGWLVCIYGKVVGKSFCLKEGINFIGRDIDMDVALLNETSVANAKHAIIVYKSKEREFYAQPGKTRELFYLNDQVVLNSMQLKKNDILTIGVVKLMFFPCCDASFSWEEYGEKRE